MAAADKALGDQGFLLGDSGLWATGWGIGEHEWIVRQRDEQGLVLASVVFRNGGYDGRVWPISGTEGQKRFTSTSSATEWADALLEEAGWARLVTIPPFQDRKKETA